MIGFRLKATSNTAYTRNYESWTEGDIWLAKAFEITESISAPKELLFGQAMSSVVPGPVDAAQAAFKSMLNGYLVTLGDVVNQIGVCVEGLGNTFFSYGLFNIKAGGMDMVLDFLRNLKRTSDAYHQELGDQVMIQICRTIIGFDKHLGFSKTGQLWIEIEF